MKPKQITPGEQLDTLEHGWYKIAREYGEACRILRIPEHPDTIGALILREESYKRSDKTLDEYLNTVQKLGITSVSEAQDVI